MRIKEALEQAVPEQRETPDLLIIEALPAVEDPLITEILPGEEETKDEGEVRIPDI